MKITSFKNDIKSMRLLLPSTAIALAGFGVACDDDTSKIGSSLTTGEVRINIDTIEFNLNATPLEYDNFDSRTGNLLIGNLNVAQYGALKCSFVSRLMCSTALSVPDSLLSPERVDSCKLLLKMGRGEMTGDSLAPQRIAVYPLLKQLPDGITNNFDPTGFYDPSSPLGSTSFTASLCGEIDTVVSSTKANVVPVYIPLPKELGKEVFELYKEEPDLFQWPQTFAKKFPGIFVESTFGKGCVSNFYTLQFIVYYNRMVQKTTTVDGTSTVTWEVARDSVVPFAATPEVLSSNNIKYNVSDYIKNLLASGESVITTPGGYNTTFKFPAKEIIDRYQEGEKNLSLISDLVLSIPAEEIENNFNIGIAPTLMLIKTSELKDFFVNNKIPDNVTSFTADYSSTAEKYTFSSMRTYILDLLKKEKLTDEDLDFTILPVSLTYETNSDYYGSSTSYVTKCSPYTIKPTMTRLHTDKATIVFTFSSQLLD